MWFEMLILYGTLEYHYKNETTGSDVLEFLALATLSESAIFGVTILSVPIDKIHLGNSTVALTPNHQQT